MLTLLTDRAIIKSVYHPPPGPLLTVIKSENISIAGKVWAVSS